MFLASGHAKSISNSAKAQLITNGGDKEAQAPAGTGTRVRSEEDPAVTRLREYIRINTGPPEPDYETAIEWFQTQAENYFDLEFNLVRFQPPDLFAIWLTWKGVNPRLKSILLNSHMDVVKADKVLPKATKYELKRPVGKISVSRILGQMEIRPL
jgi:hypothetical protein